MPTGEIITPPPSPWDDCFVGSRHAPRLDYEHLTLTVDSDCDHWVVYDMPSHATCVEPQSGPPNAFNLGVATVLEPGEILQRVMRIRWSPTTPAAPTVKCRVRQSVVVSLIGASGTVAAHTPPAVRSVLSRPSRLLRSG